MLRKNILMIQPYREQGKIWQAILKSQQLSVIWEADDFPLLEALENLKDSNLESPNLFLLDLDIKAINAYAFCRWYRQQFNDGKIILTSSDRKEISDTERRWAISQGADDLLPGFRRDSLVTGAVAGVNRVLELLESLPLNQLDLIKTLYHLASNKKQQPKTIVLPEEPILSVPPASSESTGATESTDTLSPVPAQETKPLESRPKRVYRGIVY
jgi:CheY-like chemotaxis protein